MKKTLMLAAAVCALLSVSCQKNINEQKKEIREEGLISLNVRIDDGAISKSPYLEEKDYETHINNCQILIYDEDGNLNTYQNVDVDNLSSIELSSTIGKKTIFAVINGPDLSESGQTLAEFSNIDIDLGTNWRDTNFGFNMVGSTTCDVTSSAVATPEITVSRFLSRVVLQKITNKLPNVYGSMKINGIMLTNVVANQNIIGNADITTWINKGGRNSSGTIIDCSEANSAEEHKLTSVAINRNLSAQNSLSSTYIVYGYPNNTTTDAFGWDGTSEFTARKTRLVVSTQIDGNTYYYPITLSSLERNTSYTIELTITGFGSTDPDILVEKGAYNAMIEIENWKTGEVYTEIL